MGRFSVKKITIRKLLFIKFNNKLALTAFRSPSKLLPHYIPPLETTLIR